MISILAIDSGNSFLKWGIFENNQWIVLNKMRNDDDLFALFEAWQPLKQPDLILISQVAKNSVCEQLIKLSSKIWSTQPQWVMALPKQCGVINSYKNPNQLGSDRWASLIAAWNRYYESCLVVNVGTAVTVDALSKDGIFLGGIIMPGPTLMCDSLFSNTKLDCEEIMGQYEPFPVNTPAAIYSGVVHALVGAIERMKCIFVQQHGYSIQNCIISGGGVATILPYIDFPHIFIENIVLEGLIVIADNMFQGHQVHN